MRSTTVIIDDLCAEYGGGIQDYLYKSQQSDDINIVIGLGGTGIDCLTQIKKEVFSQIVPDDPDSLQKTYSRIKFLGIDSEPHRILNMKDFSFGLERNTEFFDLGCNELFSVINHINTQTEAFKWFNKNIEIANSCSGSGAVRQIGRLLLINSISRLKDKIIDIIQSSVETVKETNKSYIHIHLITGLCGGTGSGAFLDVCYLLRLITEELSIPSAVHGYFFLPDVNCDRPIDSAVIKYCKINGYAALKELDHCMRFPTNGDSWSQNYGDFTISSNKRPVDFAYLISTRSRSGNRNINSYDYALNIVSTYVMCFFDKSYSYFKPFAVGNYYVLNATKAVIPYNDMLTYLASTVFKAYRQEIEEHNNFEEDMGYLNLGFHHIIRSIIRDNPVIQINNYSSKETNYRDYDIEDFRRRIQNDYNNTLEHYRKNTIYSYNEITKRIDDSLSALLLIPQKGPKYVRKILQGDGKNYKGLRHLLESHWYLIEEEKMKDTYYLYEKCQQNEKIALIAIDKSRLFRKRNILAYQEAVCKTYNVGLTIELYNNAIKLIKRLIRFLDGFLSDTITPMENIFDNLNETFIKNEEFFKREPDRCSYEMNLVDVFNKDFQNTLNESITPKLCEIIMYSLIKRLLINRDYWNDEKKVAAITSHVFSEQLSSDVRIFDLYLDNYCIAGLQELLSLVKDTFWEYPYAGLRCCLKRSEIWVSNSIFYTDGNAKKIHKMSLSYENEFNLCETVYENRIIILNIYEAVPLYYYYGIEIYKKIYSSNVVDGVHLYEGPDKTNCNKDYRKLPELEFDSSSENDYEPQSDKWRERRYGI